MHTSDPQVDRYGITARLLNLINRLPKGQQLVLLKQLVGDKVAQHLFKLIVEMSEGQQLILLEQLGHTLEFEPPEKTVSLEGNELLMRENPRKSCLINAQYRIKGDSFRSYILDISIGGVFVETKERMTVGEGITLNFSLPNLEQPFRMTGKIAWSGPNGFGVKFEKIPSPHGQAIRSFVEKPE